MSYWKFCHQCGSKVGDDNLAQCCSCKAPLHCGNCSSPIFPAALACGGCGKLLGRPKESSASAYSSSYTGSGYSSSSYSSVGSYATSQPTASNAYRPPTYASSISASVKSPPPSPSPSYAGSSPGSITAGTSYQGNGYGGSAFGAAKETHSYAAPTIATGAVLGGAAGMGAFKSGFSGETSGEAPAASDAAASLESIVEDVLGTDADRRRAALEELKRRPADLKELVASLEKPARIDRIRPARVLLQLEHEPVKAAAAISDALCNDPSWSTRKAALDALVSEGQKAKDAIPSLSKALADGRVDRKEISCMAAEALGAISPKAQAHAAKALEKALNSDNWFLREAAKKALEKIKK
ncbi:MAG: hypothetical protein RL095_3514 [Verrucomicrobiota bacterium]|jgi:hypothetical protein